MNHLRTNLVLAACVSLTLACSLLSGAGSGGTEPSGVSTPSAEDSDGTGGSTAEGPDMIDLTLGLRSVSLSLSATYPDGYVRHLTGEVDSTGNLHLVDPFDPGAEIQATLTPPEAGWGEFELYVVDGHAYPRMAGGAATQDDAYLTFFGDVLRGPDGPGLWLLWAGTEDLEPAAHEEIGGFAAIRYAVDATLDDGTIRGTIWVDEETSALVWAELTISPTLFSPSADPAPGDLSIVFQVTRVEVAPIRVP